MLVEGVRNIARVADSDADLELKQLERDITHRYKLSSNLRVCEQAFAVPLNVQEILRDCQTFAVFVPNGRCAKGPGAIVAWAISSGLTPPGFRVDVRRRVQFEDASSDSYRVVQLMGSMPR